MRKSYERRLRMVMALVAAACIGGSALASSSAVPPPASFGPATSTDRLQTMSGGTDVTNNVNAQSLSGTMSDNEAKNTVSGGNVVAGSAFGSSAGLPTVIQNSGNNVLIQNATIVNVRMNP